MPYLENDKVIFDGVARKVIHFEQLYKMAVKFLKNDGQKMETILSHSSVHSSG